ncbi:hypothetical protein ARMSODRAFT_1090151 [Armillaria solidipes]|uniref:Uncharacterized protein n=1 Tax=Armillaria solidipes TaxID=1076256 RepID=A0A2H3APG5_9AGAR|nr:hypothetical protein ARMSODRAFT_1090151 [Armillaria solidipes]
MLSIMPNGPPIPENSLEPLPMGNYGWYHANGREARFLPQITTMPNPPSFAAMKQTTTLHPNPQTIFDVVPSVAQAVQERDRNRCFITGTSLQGDTDLCLYPPLRDDYKRIPEFFETASNAAFLHKDLISFFLDNTFSVDVDVTADEGPDDWYLREHFRISLKVNIRDGDIREDYPPAAVLDIMADLGVGLCGGDEALEPAPMTDPRWQTVLGQSIWETVLETRMAARYVPSDNSDKGNEADQLDTSFY